MPWFRVQVLFFARGPRDTYAVSAWWPADPTYHPQATYHIHHAGGTSRVTVNQQQNGGQWNTLGTYVMTPVQNHRVVLATAVGGEVIADAIKFTAAGPARRARPRGVCRGDHDWDV